MSERHLATGDDLPDHVLRWLEAAQRRISAELGAVLDPAVLALGVRRIRVLQLIPKAGARQQELADRALVTKQAMAQALADLQEQGLASRRPDPRDGRAWLVVRTPKGDRVCRAMDAAVARVELDLEGALGVERYADFKDVLRELGAEQI